MVLTFIFIKHIGAPVACFARVDFRPNFPMKHRTILLAVAVAAGVYGCSETKSPPVEPTTTADAGAGADDGVIATVTRVCDPENCLSYINTYRSIEELQEVGAIDKSTGVEVPYSQGRTFNGSIYLFSRDETPTVTRWSVNRDLSLQKEESVNFANTGTKVFCEICNLFASKDLAFHLDASEGVVVSWNPTTMQLVELTEMSTSITGRLKGGFADILFPALIDDRAYFNAGWSNSDTLEVVDKAAVLTFDATDPTPKLQVIEDDRCGGTWAMKPFADEDGNVYAMGDWNAGFYLAGVVDPVSKPACLLRMKPGASEFDPDYYVDLLDALDARAVRNAFAMKDGNLLLNILPNSASPLTEEAIAADPWAYYSITEFRYVVLDLESLDVTPVAALGDVAAGSATPLTIDDRTFLQIYDEAEGSADLYEITTDGKASKIVNAGANSDFDMFGRVR
jgi:hypothetical protein